MALNLKDPSDFGIEPELTARISVFGVGGAGGNAVNNMIEKQLPGVEFIAANTDSQALAHSKAEHKIQFGTGVTRGLGAGSKPDVGYQAAEESIEDIAGALEGSHMCFITGGMGGGTGTGAAPVVARVAREMGILTVGVVTKPFHFEGARRMQIAEAGVAQMQKVVDTLIVIPNQNLFQVASERTTFVEAFVMADDVLYQGVQGVTDLMVRPGMINLDFADVKSVMEQMGKAMMGTGEAEGDTRAIDAAEKAIANPLLDEVSLKGAKGVLINITGGYDLTLFEMDEAANRIKEEVDPDAMIKFGSALDPDMEGKMRVSVVATGIETEGAEESRPQSDNQPPRRRPVETDNSMMAALRGAVRRPAAAAKPDAKPVHESAPTSSAEPEPQTTGNRVPPAASVAAEPEPVESQAATAPAPHDMRARAEIVRRRAMDARAQKEAETDPGADYIAFDDEADIIAPRRAPALGQGLREPQEPLAPRRMAEPASGRRETGRGDAGSRQGLFTINKLIHRVAGGGQDRLDPLSLAGTPKSDEDDESEIPAFLRRQAN
ncbi:MAG: cell division protein FtsZ [Pikeienuella sp.]